MSDSLDATCLSDSPEIAAAAAAIAACSLSSCSVLLLLFPLVSCSFSWPLPGCITGLSSSLSSDLFSGLSFGDFGWPFVFCSPEIFSEVSN